MVRVHIVPTTAVATRCAASPPKPRLVLRSESNHTLSVLCSHTTSQEKSTRVLALATKLASGTLHTPSRYLLEVIKCLHLSYRIATGSEDGAASKLEVWAFLEVWVCIELLLLAVLERLWLGQTFTTAMPVPVLSTLQGGQWIHHTCINFAAILVPRTHPDIVSLYTKRGVGGWATPVVIESRRIGVGCHRDGERPWQ